ncbi:MAG: hypothetical protein ACREA0_05365, partial [bacterium]
VFDATGEVSRELTPRPPPWRVRVVDDSLFLLIGHPAQGGDLLRLVHPDGRLISSFFDAEAALTEPLLRPHSVVFADARDGVVFAGLFGGDSVFAFDYRGQRLARVPIDPVEPLASLSRLAADQGGRLRRPDGRWVHDGARCLINVVALPDSSVALQVAEYDATLGTDPLEGGLLLVYTMRVRRPRLVTRAAVSEGLIGRDRSGGLLLLGYSDTSRLGHRLQRVVSPSGSRREF